MENTVLSSARDVKQLAEKVAGVMPAVSATEQRVAVAVYRLMAEGAPVSPAMVAERINLSSGHVGQMLQDWPGVFYDEQERVIGFWGLALKEMPHRFRVEGKQLYTWCAWDSLFIPGILGKTAHVESACPTTGQKIALTVSPDRLEDVSPSSAVVSFLTPDAPFDAQVVMTFCHYLLFFTSEDAGAKWTATHENTFLLSVEDAFEIGRLTNKARFGSALEP